MKLLCKKRKTYIHGGRISMEKEHEPSLGFMGPEQNICTQMWQMTYLDADWWKWACRKLVASYKKSLLWKYRDLREEVEFAVTFFVCFHYFFLSNLSNCFWSLLGATFIFCLWLLIWILLKNLIGKMIGHCYFNLQNKKHWVCPWKGLFSSILVSQLSDWGAKSITREWTLLTILSPFQVTMEKTLFNLHHGREFHSLRVFILESRTVNGKWTPHTYIYIYRNIYILYIIYNVIHTYICIIYNIYTVYI